jgi:hypothetical protein
MLPHPTKTRRASNIVTAGLGLVLFAMALTPAHSETLSININPSNSRDAQALNAVIGLYALHRDIQSNGHVSQNGFMNAAGILQGGRNNRGYIQQEGSNHNAQLTQNGGNNTQAILQFGNGANANVRQSGGQSGLLIQFGW